MLAGASLEPLEHLADKLGLRRWNAMLVQADMWPRFIEAKRSQLY
jgi:hypothetical protein